MPSEEETREAREVGMICAVCNRATYNIREAWLCTQCEDNGVKEYIHKLVKDGILEYDDSCPCNNCETIATIIDRS